MKNRWYSAAVTGLATELITAGSMIAWTSKDVLEIALVSALATGVAVMAYMGFTEPPKKHRRVRAEEPEYIEYDACKTFKVCADGIYQE